VSLAGQCNERPGPFQGRHGNAARAEDRFQEYQGPASQDRRLRRVQIYLLHKAPKHPDHAAQFERHDANKNFSYWVDSTKRPEKPEVDRILPVFSGSITECRHGPHKKIREITYRRHVSLRIFLKRGWYSSGEGELLGVICWPSNIFNGGTVEADVAQCTLLDGKEMRVINAKEEFLTRWGADPVRQSGDLTELIPPGAFDSASVHQGPLTLPLQPPAKDAPGGKPSFEIDLGCPDDTPPDPAVLSPTNNVNVAIAGYKPILEASQGQLWYCDLPVDSSKAFDLQASYFPFIRLGLARYQAHSMPGLELSYPVAEWAQISPRRTVRVELLGSHDVLVVVQGHGYHSSNTDQLGLPAEDIERLNHYAFRIRICRSSKPEEVPGPDKDGWLPVIMEGCALECRVTTESKEPAGPILVCRKFRLPHSWEFRSYAVIVEEFEPMVADGAIYNEPVVVDRGPTFAAQFQSRCITRRPARQTPTITSSGASNFLMRCRMHKMIRRALGRMLAVWCVVASGAEALAQPCPSAQPQGMPASKRLLLGGKGELRLA
jgi:hypothetical protein